MISNHINPVYVGMVWVLCVLFQYYSQRSESYDMGLVFISGESNMV